jgi:hypothetical protein
VQTNFLEDLKTELTRELTKIGCTLSGNDSTEDLIVRWCDYELRRIVPAQRNVEESTEFKQSRSKLSAEETAALDAIIKKLEDGDDVNGHLSKAILNADQPDLMMADWRIYHVHISNSKKLPSDFFFIRAGNLAFAIVNATTVYFLDILRHEKENWSKSVFLEIVKKNWPSLLGPYEQKGKLEPGISISDEERQTLRRAGINVPTVIGDSVVFGPGGGVTADGNPLITRRRTIAVTNLLAKLKLYFESPGIEQKVAQEVGCDENELSLKLQWDNGKVQILEEKSGKLLGLDMAEITRVSAQVVGQKQKEQRAKLKQDQRNEPEAGGAA